MNGRERVSAAMHFRKPDKVPLQYYYCPVGYYEHGEKLNDLYASLPGDFEPFRRMPVTGPLPRSASSAAFLAKGSLERIFIRQRSLDV